MKCYCLLYLLFFLPSVLFTQDDEKEKYSSSNAFKSLLIPGWGNYSAGNKKLAYLHFGAEISLWLGYFYNKNLATQSELDYQNFAVSQLSIPNKKYGNSYYKALATYNNYDLYIEYQRRQKNSILLDFDKTLRWSWTSSELREQYSQKRLEAIEYKKDIKFWIYGMVFNRVISFFTARHDISRQNLSFHSKVDFNPFTGNKLNIVINYSF